ncbi:gliding motility-associated C-terminal domain-containing protein [Ferruginibacter sp. HRS2-29]|uniref:T9SS type B sorting domain-containing protein n=1 Tax=Ferruginibacter sp. HRS2-29 TaxID=2487334 RepID=UPI0020CC9A7B|nr:gliding motility-associated C-terminal domain-containing protein [Ferruginibacter sp. HRS2-29]MCP9751659.1 hypothetical protein [Ferruginibacter sp. HRS2-29]
MKKPFYIATLLLSFSGMKGGAQKTANNWLFGNRAGITFNQSPPQAIMNGQLSSFEGSSSVSDGNGRLLFYTNGVKVYNRKNQVMQNGDGLYGDMSSTSNSVAILQPGSSTRYYIFIVSAASVDYQPLTYSVVDMTSDGGLGAVIPTEKNIEINEPIFEKIAAVRHCNKKDVWVVVKAWNSSMYYSYLLTSAGLNTSPVISNTSLVVGGIQNNSIGAIKFSADGQWMAAAFAGNLNRVQLARFNNTTGVISGSMDFDPNPTPVQSAYRGVYGIEFSPGGNMLYVSSNNSASQTLALYQYNIALPGNAAIIASGQLVTQRADWFAGGMQLGPDQKIYLTLWKDSALSVIEDPDVAGPGCNFNYNAIILRRNVAGGYLSESGLPNFIASDLVPRYAEYKFSTTRNDCVTKKIQCTISYTADVDSARWNFGDGQQSTQLDPQHEYAAYGTYTITLIIYRKGCALNELQALTYTQSLVLENSGVVLPQDKALCRSDTLIIRPSTKAENYLWSSGQVSDSILVSQPGLYWLEAELSGCISRDTIILSQKPSIHVNLGNDTTVCVEKPVVLQTNLQGSKFVWNDGTTGPLITITKPGKYWVTFESNVNCIISDTIKVAYGNCEIYFPSAFTPNGDGWNDQFGLLQNTSAKLFELSVYNRYGEMVFRSNDQNIRWDGTTRSKEQPTGTYVWLMRFRTGSGPEQIIKGTVLLIR